MLEKEKNVKEVQETAVEQNEKLPVWFAPAWSSRAVSLAINLVIVGYLTYYCTDMLGMGVGLVGTLLLASKLFDGFTDLIVGFIIDKTHTKLGKARPYELFIIFVWLFTALLYSVPDMGMTGKAVYVFIMYTLINSICATFLNGVDAVYMARSIRSNKNRVKVLTVNGIIMMACVFGVSIVMPQLIAGIGSTRAGWSKMALMFAVPLGLIGILRFIFIKEVVTDEEMKMNGAETEPLTIKTSLKAIAGNKYIFIIAGSLLIVNIINNLGTVNTYYFKYIMGDIKLQSMAALTSLVTPIALIFYPMLTKKFGNTKLLRGGALLGVIGLLIRSIGGANMGTIMVGTMLSGISIMPIGVMINVYLIECMDFGEWKFGRRVEGALTSVTSFSSKLGSGLASGFTGLIMGVAGYNGSNAVQSDSALASIVALYNYMPLILFGLMFVLALLYNLDKKMPEIKAELDQRHGKQAEQ